MKKIQESGQMYLESIFLLKKKNANIRSVDVSIFTGYSKPSVSRAMGLLKNAGLIEISTEGYITLTGEGECIASAMYERHTFLTQIFMKMGVPEEIASQDACRIEHVISDTTFSALKKFAADLS